VYRAQFLVIWAIRNRIRKPKILSQELIGTLLAGCPVKRVPIFYTGFFFMLEEEI
jgi:hypothetical protein